MTPPRGTQLFVVITESCNHADLYARNMNKHPPAKYDEYFNKLCAEMKNRESSHKVVYLSDQMPLNLRNLLENVLDKIHQPTLVIKCQKHHWSCYIYPNERASAAQDFVDNSLKVHTNKSLNTLWSKLPNEILTTKNLYQLERKQKEGPQNEEVDQQMLGEVATKSDNNESLDENGKDVKTKSPIPTKPGEKKHTLLCSVNLQDIQYLYVNHTPEIQEIQAMDTVEVTFDLESIHIMADTEEMAKQVETKIKNMLSPENLHRVEVQDLLCLEGAWENGTLLVKYMPDTVSAIGPKKLTEAFEKTLEELKESHRRLSREKIVENAEEEKHSHGKSSKWDSSKKPTASPPTSPTEEYYSQKQPLSDYNGKKSEKGPKQGTRLGLKKDTDSSSSKTKHKVGSTSKPTSEPISSSSKGKVKGEITELIGMQKGMKTYESETTGIIVKVGKSDITTLTVDAVVNAANDDLDHIVGESNYVAFILQFIGRQGVWLLEMVNHETINFLE